MKNICHCGGYSFLAYLLRYVLQNKKRFYIFALTKSFIAYRKHLLLTNIFNQRHDSTSAELLGIVEKCNSDEN